MKGYYFIDRNPKYFDRILDYLRTGELDLENLDLYATKKLNNELDYFQLPLLSNNNVNISTDVTFEKKDGNSVVVNRTLYKALSMNLWANAWCPSNKSKILYWEISVEKHHGPCGIRVGIANSKWATDHRVATVDTLCINPGNRIEGIRNVEKAGDHNSQWTPESTIIGMLFDREKQFIQFYNNKTLVCQIDEIPDPYDWFPTFTIHCARDQITLIENPVIPIYDIVNCLHKVK